MHQKSKSVMLLSQVKLAGYFAIDTMRDRHELYKYNSMELFMRIFVMKFYKSIL